MKQIGFLCFTLLAVVLSGCQSNPKVITDASIASRDAELAALKPWRARGSLVVNSKAQGVINATFAWDATNNGFDIRLIGPLGMGTYRITEDDGAARLIGDNQEYNGSSAEALLFDAIGVRVPLVDMQDWVVGLQGKATNARRDNQGRIRRMQVTAIDKSEWDVNFQRYAKVQGLQLPKQILVSGDDVEIKLSIRNWNRLDVAAADVPTILSADLN